MASVFCVLFFAMVPAVLIFACTKCKPLAKIGVVLLCYFAGMLVGNTGILPSSFVTPSSVKLTVCVNGEEAQPLTVGIRDNNGNTVQSVTLDEENGYTAVVTLPCVNDLNEAIVYTADSTDVSLYSEDGDSVLKLLQSITICLALPLILFSLDIRTFFRVAKKGMLCMLLACFSVMLVTFVLHLIFRSTEPDSARFAAGAVAVYTGGTVNFGAIRSSIGIADNDYILFNTYDSVVSVVYIFFLSTVGRSFFTKVMRLRPYADHAPSAADINSSTVDESIFTYKELLQKRNVPDLLAAFALSAAVFGVSYALNLLVSQWEASLGMTVMMLSVTTISVALSFVERIRRLKKSFQLGMYIMYIFCFSVAASADFKALLQFNLPIFCYVFVSIAAGLLLHALLSKLCRIDTDTFIITSVSAVCSPPFVPSVAASLGNNRLLVSGLATGVVGYAAGNYLGTLVFYLYGLL
ncbi:MAG: DUF819 family protein [Clostridia bacterium]|nr:DUF819 family protein [Clostridia bacterium]